MSFEELRTKLLEQVKTDKQEIQELEKRVREVKKLNETTVKKLNKIKEELNGGNEMSEEQKKKFEVLYTKEKEIDRFLQNFENLRKKRLDELNQIETQNLKILETISKHLTLTKYAPSQQNIDDIQREHLNKKVESDEDILRKV